MKQALHIFRKDLRYLCYDVALALLGALVFCVMGARHARGPGPVAIFLPAIWWFLIARVVHAEALPGNQQFWLTRPYEWSSLLGAKGFFILTFVNLPLLVADAVIIHAAGFSILEKIAGLLWTQVLLVAAFVLPAVAFAAITSGLAEFLVVTLLLVFAILAQLVASSVFPYSRYWMELEWIKTYCLLAELAGAAVVVLVWQYARRNTLATRLTTAMAALVLMATSALLPWRMAFALQTHLSQRDVDISALRIRLDSERKWLGHVYVNDAGQVVAELPIRITGLPAGTECKPNGVNLTIRAPNGAIGNTSRPPQVSFEVQGDVTSLRAVMAPDFYVMVKDQPIELRGTLFFTVYGDKQTALIPLENGQVPVTGLGLCSAGSRFLLCNSAFRPHNGSLSFRMLQDVLGGSKAMVESPSGIASYSPFPAEANIDPLFQFFSPRMSTISEVRVEVRQPIAYLEQTFEMDGVRLSEFAVRPSAQVTAPQAYWPATKPEDQAH